MPKKLRATTNPLGLKLLEVMRDKQLGQDFAAVAKAFGVKVPSVYDWVDHGRIDKRRYARLVEWSGRSLHWWFDVPAPVDAPDSATRVIHLGHATPPMAAEPPHDAWPFPRVSPSRYRASPPSVKHDIETYALAAVNAAELTRGDAQKSNGG